MPGEKFRITALPERHSVFGETDSVTARNEHVSNSLDVVVEGARDSEAAEGLIDFDVPGRPRAVIVLAGLERRAHTRTGLGRGRRTGRARPYATVGARVVPDAEGPAIEERVAALLTRSEFIAPEADSILIELAARRDRLGVAGVCHAEETKGRVTCGCKSEDRCGDVDAVRNDGELAVEMGEEVARATAGSAKRENVRGVVTERVRELDGPATAHPLRSNLRDRDREHLDQASILTRRSLNALILPHPARKAETTLHIGK